MTPLDIPNICYNARNYPISSWLNASAHMLNVEQTPNFTKANTKPHATTISMIFDLFFKEP